jgi:hypothetical protein
MLDKFAHKPLLPRTAFYFNGWAATPAFSAEWLVHEPKSS